MKTLVMLLIVLLLISISPIFAQSESTEAVWESTYDRWDFAVSLSGGFSYKFKLAGLPALDLIVSSYRIEDFVPIDFGVSVRSLITNFVNDDNVVPSGWLHIGIGVIGVVHLSFNNLQAHTLPFLENFDFYAGFGPVYDIILYSGFYEAAPPPIPSNGIGLNTTVGVRYFFLDWLAVNLELFNWRFSPGVSAGLTFNF